MRGNLVNAFDLCLVYALFILLNVNIRCGNHENNQQDALYRLIYYSKIGSTCFGRYFRPSSRALDCIYSIW